MSNYYTLGAELPDLAVDDPKLDMTTEEFVNELRAQATPRDRRLIDLVLLRGDNRNLIALLRDKELPEEFMPTAIPVERLRELVESTREWIESGKDDLTRKRWKDIPDYLVNFTEEYLSGKWEESPHFPEDILHGAYMDYAARNANAFLTHWFKVNQYILNILAAVTAKKYDLDTKKYLVGESELVQTLRSGVWSELTILDDADIIADIMKIGEEIDLVHRERRIDEFKWKLLDRLTFADPFSIDAMLAYLLRLQILQRWTELDRERGIKRFKELIAELSKQGKEKLKEFMDHTQKQKRSPVLKQ